MDELRELRELIMSIATRVDDVCDDVRGIREGERTRAIRAVVARMVAKEQIEANRAATRGGQFLQWVDRFYGRHESKMLAALAAEGIDGTAAVRMHCIDGRELLLTASECQPDELAAKVAECVEAWESRVDCLTERLLT